MLIFFIWSMCLDYSVHDRDASTFNAEDHYISKLDSLFFMNKEQDIATLKRWLHRPAEYHDNRRVTPSKQNQPFPYHQGRSNYKSKANELQDKVTTLHRSNLLPGFACYQTNCRQCHEEMKLH